MIKGLLAIYLRELFILKRRLLRQIPSWSISPILYLIAFGYAMGKYVTIGNRSYMEFLIPGIAAMSSMTQAFAISSEINISRFYWHIFEEFQSAPISNFSYVAGEVLAGITRSFLAVLMIIIIGFSFGIILSYNVLFWLAIFLNSFIFASLAVGLAMIVKSHSDQAMLNSFIITPMAFLGGTFFPIDRLPQWAQKVIYFLPLTHASKAIRSAAFEENPNLSSYFILAIIGIIFFFMAVKSVTITRE
ncbi:MAG: ABC transporter permease [Desulfobacterales bacterium]|nr:ABC transporter permease [Desulfobacterales bacterium]